MAEPDLTDPVERLARTLAAKGVDHLASSGFSDPTMTGIMSWESRIAAMVEVERALALAAGSIGLVPHEDAVVAAEACDVQRIDVPRLAAVAAHAATPVIPLVAALRSGLPGPAAAALHTGATSQDIVDTASVLQLRAALDHIESLLLRIADRCAHLAQTHVDDVMAGRTLGQQAVPITFGLKAARWLSAISRRIVSIRRIRSDHMAVQFGGAAGTLGAFGPHGLRVAEEVARILELAVPVLPRHAERDHVADIAGALGTVAGAAGRIATDLVMLAQTEVAELSFGSDGPTSSAMPHKRNPVDAVASRAAARLAMSEAAGLITATADHEFERSAGTWQAEWVALPSLLGRTSGALDRLLLALLSAAPDTHRMRQNLDLGLGLTASEALGAALSRAIGPVDAAALTSAIATEAAISGRSLAAAALEDAQVVSAIGASGVAEATDPRSALQGVRELVERSLAEYRDLRSDV